MKWVLDLIRRLPSGGVSISWRWDLGRTAARGSMKKRLLTLFRFPVPTVAKDKKIPPSLVAADDTRPKFLVESTDVGFFPNKKKEQPVEFSNYFPSADRSFDGVIRPTSKFQNSSPFGVTVHYTASRNISSTIKELASKNLGYHLIIDRNGAIYQCAELIYQLNHAGRALWNGKSPNREHLAVALVSWGWVKRLAPGAFVSWSGRTIATEECAHRQGQWWDAATPEQELALLKFLRWAILQGVGVSEICGHDECVLPKGRKVDPGGVLSLSMSEIRGLLSESIV